MTITETTMHHFVCSMCDNDKCKSGTPECEYEQWKKRRADKENKE